MYPLRSQNDFYVKNSADDGSLAIILLYIIKKFYTYSLYLMRYTFGDIKVLNVFLRKVMSLN